ncbi:MAG: hypothetical protein JSS09_05295, partial [Verrucomicrobia bacterium]|nr:hypothetical protein [Verrucomicrobiota bacterium]
KKEQEDNESSKKIIQDAQALIEKQEDSLYAIQKPNIKNFLKRKKTSSSEVPSKPFSLPSLEQTSLFFKQDDFSLNLSEPPAEWIEKEKMAMTLGIQGIEISLETIVIEDPVTPISIKQPEESHFTSDTLFSEKAQPSFEESPLFTKGSFEPLKKDDQEDSNKLSEERPITFNKKKLTVEPPCELISQVSPLVFSFPIEPSSESSNFHHFSADFFALFERIVGVITVLQTKPGSSKTTLNLNQPQFASSIFFGSQITIEECDSAPKEFNIRFCGSEQAVKNFTAHKQELEAALAKGFEQKKLHFKVHQIETDLSAE